MTLWGHSKKMVSKPRKWSKVKVTQSCPTLWDPTDNTVHGILQARILELLVFPFSRGSSKPRDQTQVSHIAGGFFTRWATREAQEYWIEFLLKRRKGDSKEFKHANSLLLDFQPPGLWENKLCCYFLWLVLYCGCPNKLTSHPSKSISVFKFSNVAFYALSPWNLHDLLLLLICLLVLLYGIWDSALFPTEDNVLCFSKASSCLMQGLASGKCSKSTYWIVLKGILLQNNLVKTFLYLKKGTGWIIVSNNKNSIHFLETLQVLSIFLWHWISKEIKLLGKPK